MNDEEKIIEAFPSFLKDNVSSLISKVELKGEHPISDSFEVILDNEKLAVPYRIYFEEPKEQSLNKTELLIVNCLFTRHHNGFIRQKRLEQILLSDEYWMTPFIVQLLGEYVREIILTIEDNLTENLLKNLRRFIRENPKFFETTKSRMISYWNCYYRTEFPNKENYVGFKIPAKISQFVDN